ncbi:hypothetical protein SBF1_1590011 [Candidatus Desulfosporosinus infrequens]|uniref:Uncharacterized protein n=1 Tax=Candidatus Desulfosporosinus infrequens TaxID=2043169 RepID=A0A2U3K902_9FIRM|nr:hypothetical protein SBF1_1590011 [Candidatus Desulfosporosinus infrequens]
MASGIRQIGIGVLFSSGWHHFLYSVIIFVKFAILTTDFPIGH